MILFLRDWDKYPTARPHWDTKNRSFVKQAYLYKRMGKRNFAFHLALVDQELRHVNPHDANLSLELKAKVLRECKINPWYYLREVARAPGSSGLEDAFIRANRGIIAAWWLYLNHITYVHIQPRQTGKSFSFDNMMVYSCNVAKTKSKMAGLTSSEALRVETIERIKDLDRALPPYVRRKRKDDARNNFSFTVNALGNSFRLRLPAKSEGAADALGRGFKVDSVGVDEGPFLTNGHITIPVLQAASIDARAKAKEAGSLYCVAYTTTAGTRTTETGRFFYNMQEGFATWDEEFFDCKDAKDLEETIRANSRATTMDGKGVLGVTAAFDHRQLGKTDQWIKDQIELTGLSGDKLKMDLFNIWPAGGEGNPLPPEILEMIESLKCSHKFVERDKHDNYMVKWYIGQKRVKQYKKGRALIISVDTSDALGNDDIGYVLEDPETGEVVGAGSYNRTSINQWAKWLFRQLMKYPSSVLMMELKSSAMSIIDTVVDMLLEVGQDPFKRIVNMVVNNAVAKPKLFKELEGAKASGRLREFYYAHKKMFGYTTTGTGQTSRNILYGGLEPACKLKGHLINDKTLQGQILGLIVKNNRIDHRPGEHDDAVIAWLLSYWLLTSGDNLKYYGLNPLSIYTRIRPYNSSGDDDMKSEVDPHVKIRERIINLKAEINRASNDAVRMALQDRLNALTSALPDSMESDTYNKTQVVEEVKREKVKKRNRVNRDDFLQWLL